MTAAPALAPHPPATTLRRLLVRDFRNIALAELELPADGIAVIGENGQGKTNLLEAIYYLQLLRSFRGARDQELVRFGQDAFFLGATIAGASASEVSVGFERPHGRGRPVSRKRARLNGGEPARLTDALGALPAVIFSPQDAAIVAGGPSLRRRFLDVMLALTSRSYLSALQRYRAALLRRHAAMRAPGRSALEIESRVAVWEPALAEHGAHLWRERMAWVERNATSYATLCTAIGEEGVPRMRLVSGATDDEDLAAQLAAALEQKRALDIRRGVTHAGPHRDDVELTLDGHELRTYGSAGQQRTGAMALRLLEAATLRERSRSEPVVLLDDPFAELDARRSSRILELLESEGRGQTVLVVPRSGDIPEGLTRLERRTINRGAIGQAAG